MTQKIPERKNPTTFTGFIQRCIVLFVSLVLVCSCMAGAVSATVNEVQIVETGVTYANLSLAVDAVSDGGTATIKLLDDMQFNSSVVIGSMNGKDPGITKTITIDGNGRTVTRGTLNDGSTYMGNFLTLYYGSNLTVQDLTIDAGGNWTLNQAMIDAYIENPTTYTTAVKPVIQGTGDIIAKASLIINKGDMILDDVVIRNFHSHSNGVSLIDNGCNIANHDNNIAELTIRDSDISKVAVETGTAAIVDMYESHTNLTLEGNTKIHHNFGNGNGGMIKVGAHSYVIMNDGVEISHNIATNSNGVAIMLYDGDKTLDDTVFEMNGGSISHNIAMSGNTNGRCGAVYLHFNSVMYMNGGEISDNIGIRAGAIDVRETAKLYLKKGAIKNNQVLSESSSGSSILSPNGDDVIISDGAELDIIGSIYTAKKITNNGRLAGDIAIIYTDQDRPNYWENSGMGVISAKMRTDLRPDSNQQMVNFDYDGGIDTDQFINYQLLLDTNNPLENVNLLRTVSNANLILEGWYDEQGNKVTFPLSYTEISFNPDTRIATYKAKWISPEPSTPTPTPTPSPKSIGTSIWLTETPTPTPTNNETAEITNGDDSLLAPTDIPTYDPDNGDDNSGGGFVFDGKKPFNGTLCIFGGILALLLLFFFLILLIFRHRVTFLMPVNGEIKEYCVRVWHGRLIKQDKLPKLLQNAEWYLDEEKTQLWNFEEDKVKKSFKLYLG